MVALLLDCGNSACKYRCGGESGRFEDLTGALAGIDRLVPSEVVLASVSRFGHDLAGHLSERRLPLLRLAVRDGQAGLKLAYRQPEQLGVDRWLALLAVVSWRRPVVVIDAGTALTIDALDGEGRHLGGYILPGLTLMRRTLVDDTFALPPVTAAGVVEPGRDTPGCIANGSVLALAGAVEAALGRLPLDRPTVVWTGGDAETLRPHCEAPGEFRPELIFEGMQGLIRDTAYRATLT